MRALTRIGVIVSVLAACAILPAAHSSATPAPLSDCTGTIAIGQTVTCAATGDGYRDITVPADVHSISVDVRGGGGGQNVGNGSGGNGAKVTATVNVTAGDALRLYVGSGGGRGGFGNSGGTGYARGGSGGQRDSDPWFGSAYGGGGGGSSALFINGSMSIVAGGGGGGGGGSNAGGDSLFIGADGGAGHSSSIPGGGGNAGYGGSSGATLGTGKDWAIGGAGGQGTAGGGGDTSGGGGGGAGYGGGGGGGFTSPYLYAGGGGGGASFGPAGAAYASANNAGLSGAGGAGSITVTFNPNPPSAPAILITEYVTTSGFTATWTAPVNDGGAAVSRYEVVVTRNGNPEQTQSNILTTTLDITGLLVNTHYDVSVRAYNAAGWSSATSTSVNTLLTPPDPDISAGDTTVGIATTIAVAHFAPGAETIRITAPDGTSQNYPITVDGHGVASLTYTPMQSGTYTAETLGALTDVHFNVQPAPATPTPLAPPEPSATPSATPSIEPSPSPDSPPTSTPTLTPSPTTTTSVTTYFKKHVQRLSNAGQRELRVAIASMSGTAKAKVIGAVPPHAKKQERTLTLTRAKDVARYLRTHGFKGKVTVNTAIMTPTHTWRDRRVEVTFITTPTT